MDDSADELLGEMRAVGRLDSVGTFTLDAARAADRLGHLRFGSPYEYVLKLVQAGVASGAGLVEVRVRGGTVSVSWNRAHLVDQPVGDLLRYAWEAAPDRWLSHLGAGLLAAMALAPSTVEVSCWRDGQGVRWTRRDGQERAERLQGPDAGDGTRLVFRGMRRPWRRFDGRGWCPATQGFERRSLGDLALDFGCLWDSERAQIWRRCLFAPVTVRLDGRVVNNPFFGQPRRDVRLAGAEVRLIPYSRAWGSLRFLMAPAWGPDVVAGPSGIPVAYRSGTVFPRWYPMQSTETPGEVAWYEAERLGDRPRRRPSSEEVVRLDLPPVNMDPLVEARVWRVPADDAAPLWLWEMPAVPCHAMAWGSNSLDGELVLVHDGVVIRRQRPPRPSLRNRQTICSAATLDFDLSGMAPVENEKWAALLDALELLG